METILASILAVVWHRYVAYSLVLFGGYATLRMGFMQIRHLPTMFRLLRHAKTTHVGILSSLQSFMISIGGRVGTGNISGVASAVIIGGPGAIFWMWVAAFVGCATSFVESVMGQLYKVSHNSGRCAGIALYAEKLTSPYVNPTFAKVLCIVIATILTIVFGCLVVGPQANALSQSFAISFGFPGWLSGLLIAITFLTIVIGGVTRIAHVVGVFMPLMGTLFILTGVVLIVKNIQDVPSAFVLIWNSAFHPNAALGGLLGAMIPGIMRGVYSNEAGIASMGPHIGGIAETRHPAEQGFVQALVVYVDTWIVCTIMALALIMTNSYNIFDSDGVAVFTGVAGAGKGDYIDYVYTAFNRGIVDGFSSIVMPVILSLFIMTTMLGCYLMSEINANIIDLKKPQPKILGKSWLLVLLPIISAAWVFYASMMKAELIWSISDIGIGVIVIINIALMVLGFPRALKVYRDYTGQLKSGVHVTDVTFNPKAIGITDADFWNKAE